MDPSAVRQTEHILVLDPTQRAVRRVAKVLESALPSTKIFQTHTLENARALLESEEFDVVVMDYAFGNGQLINLVHEFRLRDEEPGILVVCAPGDPRLVTDLYTYGCQKCVVKSAGWIGELAPSVRHLLRLRRLENENRRLLAKLTEANALLEEKNKRLDEFSASLAHDIRGPLGGLMMRLELMIDQFGSTLEPRLNEMLSKSLQSGERLTSVVQSMYEYAKLGAKAAHMRSVNLEQLLNEVVNDLNFPEELQIKIGIGELPSIWGSAELLVRVFSNLINNAVKYNDKPQIEINVGVERVVERSIARFCEIYVEDNGPGIPADELDLVFSMFSRGKLQRDNKEGTGVGLSVVQRIVDLHYGEIRVQSEVGKGTRFILSLPLDQIDFCGGKIREH